MSKSNKQDKILAKIIKDIYMAELRSSNTAHVAATEPGDGILKHELAGQQLGQAKMAAERYAIAKVTECVSQQHKSICKNKKTIDFLMKRTDEYERDVKKLKKKNETHAEDTDCLYKELADLKKLVKEQKMEIKQLKKIVKSFCVFLEISKQSDSLEATQKKCVNKLGGVNISMLRELKENNVYLSLIENGR